MASPGSPMPPAPGGPPLKGKYKLGEVLGKGGWGTVYKGWNLESGEFVAVKQISFQNIPKEQLKSIQSEIQLLQNLRHPRIVKYIDSMSTDDSLYIVLDRARFTDGVPLELLACLHRYVENGSLERVLNKFGAFPEHLIAVYMAQVLEGLVYLHEQGVIHRDIKAANLLTTKEGYIKLADFGVATETKRGHESDTNDPVAGSPYWMAPEIIEMNGATTKSDIWSCGCTIIELLTGKPPHFDLEMMAALFRIVQDDCPPLPEDISPLLRDFLMQCFQKEPMLRQSADKLLKHRWITNALKKMNAGAENVAGTPVKAIEDYNAQKKKATVVLSAPATPLLDYAINRRERSGDRSKPSKKRSGESKRPVKTTVSSTSNTASGTASAAKSKLAKFREGGDSTQSDDDNWDDDFAEPAVAPNKATTKPSSKPASRKGSFKEESDDDDWDADFDGPAVKPNLSASAAALAEATGMKASSSASKVAKFKETAKDDEWDDVDFDETPAATEMVGRTLKPGLMEGVAPEMLSQSNSKVKSFAETEESWDDFDSGTQTPSSTSSQLAKPASAEDLADRLKLKLNSKWDDQFSSGDLEDPFDVFDDDEDEFGSGASERAARDELTRITAETTKAINGLQPDNDEASILDSCAKLLAIFRQHSAHKEQLISQTGVIPFIEMLQSTNQRVVQQILCVSNEIIQDNNLIAESFCVMGGIPSFLQYAAKTFPRNIRLETASFVRQILQLGKKTIKMFIASRGLPVLVDFLDVNDLAEYVGNKDLINCSVDSIIDIFEFNLQIHIPKNDFCRLLAKAGLLPRLARVFAIAIEDNRTSAFEIDKIAEIFVTFSKADVIVKTHFCDQEVLKRLFKCLEAVENKFPPAFVKILKSIRTLSMQSSTLELMAKAGAIKTLVPFLAPRQSEKASEAHQQLYAIFHNLCRLSQERLAMATRAGIIPHLIWVIKSKSPLKQFALPLILDAARYKKTRSDMPSRTEAIKFYLELFEQQFPWQVQAIDAIYNWLTADPKKVLSVLEENIPRFVSVFINTRDEALVAMLDPFLKILNSAHSISRLLSQEKKFMIELMARLKHSNAQVRLQMIRLLQNVFENAKSQKHLVQDYDLASVVGAMSRDTRVLVAEIATSLLQQINKLTRQSVDKSERSLNQGGSMSLSAPMNGIGSMLAAFKDAGEGLSPALSPVISPHAASGGAPKETVATVRVGMAHSASSPTLTEKDKDKDSSK